MSSDDDPPTREAHTACASCLRRSWLLSMLSAPLDYVARDRERLHAVLALCDLELLQAVGGRRRAELQDQYHAFQPGRRRCDGAVRAVCRHNACYPEALSGPAAPPMLNVAGGTSRLAALCSTPLVAIVGSRAPSDYGWEMARSFARGLAGSGVGVIGGWSDGIPIAAHTGALQSTGATLAVIGSGLHVSSPARRRALLRRVTRSGCAISELPCDCGGRRWGALAGERIVAQLAAITVVVEAEDTVGELWPAYLAKAHGRAVAAIPGRVTSPLSQGANALLMNGAVLVRDVQDVLNLLHTSDRSRSVRSPALSPYARLEPRLRAVLERVGAGRDTPDSLTSDGADPGEMLLALSELELLGALCRGDGGRYAPTHPLPRSQQRTGDDGKGMTGEAGAS